MNEKELIRIAKPLYKNRDSMHDFRHILRIKRKVKFLGEEFKNIDDVKLKFIIYFHGQAEWVRKNKKKLLKLGIPREYFAALTRHTKNPRTIEEKLVSDANLLEAVGKFGIKKAMTVGRDRGQKVKETIAYMKKNIRKVKFYTKKGKVIGNKGINFTKNWLRGK